MTRTLLRTMFLLLAFFFLTAGNVFAENYYWRAYPLNNNLSSAANWVTNEAHVYAQGETTPSTPTDLPANSDDLFFTAPSIYTTLSSQSTIAVNNLFVTAIDNDADDATTANFVMDYNITLYGSVESNGNFTFSGTRTIAFAGSVDAAIDWGTDGLIGSAVSITIDKAGANVEMLNHDITIGGSFTLSNCASFKTNGKNITVGSTSANGITIATTALGVDLSASILTAGGAINILNSNQPNCTIVSNTSNNSTIWLTLTSSIFKELQLLPTSTSSTTMVSVGGATIGKVTALSSGTRGIQIYGASSNYSNITTVDITAGGSVQLSYINAGDIIAKSIGYYVTLQSVMADNITTTAGSYANIANITVNNKLTIDATTYLMINAPNNSSAVSTNILNLKKALPIQLYGTLSLKELILENYDCTNYYTMYNLTEIQSWNSTTVGIMKNTGSNSINLDGILTMGISFEGSDNSAFTASDAFNAGGNRGTITWIAGTPKDYYWIGGAGNWYNGNNWSNISSTGAACGCVPTAIDNVYFDNSSISTGQTITTDRLIACNDFTWNMGDMSKKGMFNVTTGAFIGGNLDVSGMQSITGDIYLTGKAGSSATTYTVTTNNTSLNNLYVFPDPVNTYQLIDDLTCSNYLTHTSGGFSSNEKSITCEYLYSAAQYPSGATRSLDLKNSKVRVTGGSSSISAMNLSQTGMNNNYDFTSSHFTFAYDGAILNATGQFDFHDITFEKKGVFTFTVSTNTMNILTFESANGTFNYGFTVNDLILAPYQTYAFSTGQSSAANRTITIKNSLTATSGCEFVSIKGASESRPLILKNETGTRFEIPGLKAQYVNYVGATEEETLLAAGGENLGNNSNIEFEEKIGQVFYWIGNTGNWSDTAHWSFDSNGESCGCIPGVNDTAIFDENSFTMSNQTVTMDLPDPRLHSLILDEEAAIWTPTLIIPNSTKITFTGSFDVASGAKLTPPSASNYSATFTFTGSSQIGGDQVIRFDQPSTNNLGINITGSGRFDVLSDMKILFEFIFAATDGNSLYLKNCEINTLQEISISQGTDSYIDISGSTFNQSNASSSLTLSVKDCSKFIHDDVLINCLLVQMYSPCDLHFDQITATTLRGSITNGAIVSADAIIGRLTSSGLTVSAAGYSGTVVTASLINVNAAFTGGTVTATTSYISVTAPLTATDITTKTYINVSAAGSIDTETITAGSYITTAGPIVAESINVGSYLTVSGANGNIIADNLSVGTDIQISNGNIIEINESLTLTGNPCTVRNIQGSSSANGVLKFNYCNPEVSFVNIEYITAELLSADECEGIEQVFTVYGQALAGGNNENIVIKKPIVTGDNTNTPLLVACIPHLLDLAKSEAVTYQWYISVNNVETIIEGATDRYLEVDEDGTYVLYVSYGVDCDSRIIQDVSFDANRTWTALGEPNDWNDKENWSPKSVPDLCSYVTIPGGLDHYPIIEEESETYDAAKCYIIHFKFGGEVKNTHLLTYTSAVVEMDIKSNQWYMTTAPLKNTYSGDYYSTTSNPFTDYPREEEGIEGMQVRTQKFHASNPELETYHEYNWTGGFNTNDIELQAGEGLAVFANPRKTGWTNQDYLIPFVFPKEDEFHYYYDNKTEQPYGRGADLNRDYKGRFIYETNDNEASADGLVTVLNMDGTTSGEIVLVGNPFMAHLDFLTFAKRNEDCIDAEYKISYGVTGSSELEEPVSYSWISGQLITTDTNLPTNPSLISPLMSFFVTLNTANGATLKAHVEEDTQTNPDPDNNNKNTLRAPSNFDLSLLRIKATMGVHTSNAVVVAFPEANPAYVSSEDSYKLFSSTTTSNIMLYTLSSDNKALDINSVNDFTGNVPLGFRTLTKGDFSFSFTGTEHFEELYLIDTYTSKRYLLENGIEYPFSNSSEQLYNNDRFYLYSPKAPTGIDSMDKGDIVISSNNNHLYINSIGGENINALRVVDMQGRMIVSESDIASTYYSSQMPEKGIYIVTVTGDKSSITKKVVIR